MTKQPKPRYVVCVKNDDYSASLELRKIYDWISDPQAEQDLVRVIDESGDDYLYPKDYFVEIPLPNEVATALKRAS
jgi:hypothetical protein